MSCDDTRQTLQVPFSATQSEETDTVSTEHPLRTMIDRMLDPWPLRIDWAERVYECSAECNTAKIAMDLVELRHYADPCPSHIEYRQTYSQQVPVLTQLFEAKYEVPATGNTGKGATKLHPPLPGNLVTPDTLMWNIRMAAGTVAADWSAPVRFAGSRITAQLWLQALRAAQGRRTPEELDDAAGALEPSYGAAMRYLGYDTDRVMLADTCCDRCGGVLSCPRELGQGAVEVRCEGWRDEGPCGRAYAPEEWLAMHAARPVANGAKTHCPQKHPYDHFNTRIGKDRKRRCLTCEAERRIAKAAAARMKG
jgi:hypothetical protein